MRLGLYYDLRNPGGARSWARVYAAALDRIGWADGAGIGAIWGTWATSGRWYRKF